MRRMIFAGLLATTLAPAMVQAQDPYQQRQEIRDQRREIRDNRDEIRNERRDVRDERREDWRDYRRAHPDIYQGQRWEGPRGYAYRPVGVGYRFTPEFYDRHYWVDPSRYHLRPVGYGQRWVHYGNDVLLVDVRSGRVLEVNGGFFR